MPTSESDLYLPVKRFLTSQGYEVKGEVGACDIVARRGDEQPVVVELKLNLSLDLILQAVDRLSVTPNVYIGVPSGASLLKRRRRHVLKLLRMLGLGLLVVDLGRRNGVAALLDPGEYRPRPSRKKEQRLLGEFDRRIGDPNLGGTPTRNGIMTAYRQRAVRIGVFLEASGPTRASLVAAAVDDSDARGILYTDVYGWFDRPTRGVYALSPRGAKELRTWATRA